MLLYVWKVVFFDLSLAWSLPASETALVRPGGAALTATGHGLVVPLRHHSLGHNPAEKFYDQVMAFSAHGTTVSAVRPERECIQEGPMV